MFETEYRLLNLFKNYPEKEFSTSEIVSIIFPDIWEEISKINEKISEKEKRALKRKKAQLHRKLLYYLNKLEKEKIIRVSKEGAKGEKFFILNISPEEEVIIGKTSRRKVILTAPILQPTPVDGYEKNGVVEKFEPSTWVTRLNAILINSFNLQELEKILSRCFEYVNDVVAINNFQNVLESEEIGNIIKLTHQIKRFCVDFGKQAVLIFDVGEAESKAEQRFFDWFPKSNVDNLNLFMVFELSSKDFVAKQSFLESLANFVLKEKMALYVKNKNIVSAPYFLGKAGPYSLDEKNWESLKTPPKIIPCAQSTISINVEKFFALQRNINLQPFIEFLLKNARALLSAATLQKRHLREYFNFIIESNEDEINVFDFSRSYLRLYNYGWKQPNFDQEVVVDLLTKAKKRVGDFCRTEEIIYMSCGMPLKFKIAFGVGERSYYSSIFEPPKFQPIIIKNTQDFFSKNVKKELRVKEKLAPLLSGGDRTGIHRAGDVNDEIILHELEILLSNFSLPFFSYDFGGARIAAKLDVFLK